MPTAKKGIKDLVEGKRPGHEISLIGRLLETG